VTSFSMVVGNVLFLLLEHPTQEALFTAPWWSGKCDESTRVFGKPSLDVLFRFYTITPGVLAYRIESMIFVGRRGGGRAE
jgi:hypothetical protein